MKLIPPLSQGHGQIELDVFEGALIGLLLYLRKRMLWTEIASGA